jgi:hypothetical protein
MEKQFLFYDSEVSKLSMSGNSYWSEKPNLTLLPKKKDFLRDNIEIFPFLTTDRGVIVISLGIWFRVDPMIYDIKKIN